MGLERSVGSLFRFGDTEVDVARRELRRGGARVSLQRKPFELLVRLLHGRDRTITYDELRAEVWPRVQVSDATIGSTLRDLRRALGNTGGTSRCILTVRGVGLRFVGAVQEVACARERVFVGREAELARLRELLGAGRAGTGGVALLAGEAGIGKTRAAEEFAAAARAAGAAVYVGRCRESRARPPYGPWSQLLTALVESVPAARRRDLVEGIAAELSPIAPELAAGPARTQPEGDEAAVYRLFDAVAMLLRRAARQELLVLILEDLDRADPSSIDLLQFIARAAAEMPLLLLGTCRTGGAPRALDALPGERLELARLGRAEVAEFVRRVGIEARPQSIAALHERSGGNPLFLRELVWFAVDRAAAAGIAAEAELSVGATPPSLREWIRGRLLALSPPTRGVLEAAALFGREVEPELVARASGLDPEAVLEAFDEAARAGLLAMRPPAGWCFVHALLPELIEADLDPPRRGELHQQIGELLGTDGSEEAGARWSQIAGHLLEAADRVGLEAAEALVRAGEHAERRLAYADACEAYEHALALRAEIAPGDDERTCDLLLSLARARVALRRMQAAWECAGQAVEMARRLRSPDRFARAVLVLSEHITVERAAGVFELLEEALQGLPSEAAVPQARLLAAMSMQLHYAWQPERREAFAEKALAAARRTRDPEVVAAALLERRNALVGPRRLRERMRLLDELVTLADCATRAHYRLLGRAWRAVDHLNAADLEAAEADVAEIARIAREESAPRFLAFPVSWSAMRATGEGRFVEADRLAREAAIGMQRAEDPNAAPFAGLQIGTVYYEQGRWAEVARLLAGSREWLGPHRRWMPMGGAMLSFLDLVAGDREPAMRDFQRLAADGFAVLDGDPDALCTASWLACSIGRIGTREHAQQLLARLEDLGGCQTVASLGLANRGALARYMGLLARRADRLDEAEHHLEDAIARNRKLGLALYETRAQRDLAALLAERDGAGDRERSELLAREADARFASLGVAPIAREAGL